VRDAEVRYAVRDGTRLAYEVFGTGSCDIVLFQSVCPIDLMWDLPELASFLETLGTIGRVIAYDPRGLGASDPSSDDGAAIIETHADDLLAVLSASGSRRATIFDLNYGLVSSVFAATHPQHVRSLIMCHLRTSFPELHSFSEEQRQQIALARLTTESLEVENPRVAHDPVLRQWWARSRRLLHSPYSVLRNIEIALRIDTTAALPAVRAPTLVLHRRDLVGFDIETSRELASHIPGAQFVELPGSEEALFLGDTAPAFAVVTPFIHQEDTEVANDDRPLATVLFSDIVASTAQLAAVGDAAWRRVLDAYDDLVDRAVATHRGHVVKKMGDGVLATFDGPARAVHCAAVIRDGVAEHGVMVRSGLHTGEIERRVGDVAGIAVHIASRVAALAEPGEILVSRTVVDLTAGSGIGFQARGDHQLKGVPGDWQLFAAN
jgi:class 3 adenylate cyclase/pimeloyl-ACP methyl ester carboxylesterase